MSATEPNKILFRLDLRMVRMSLDIIYNKSRRCPILLSVCITHHLLVDFRVFVPGERSIRAPAWHQSLRRVCTWSLHFGHQGFFLFLKGEKKSHHKTKVSKPGDKLFHSLCEMWHSCVILKGVCR